MIRNLAVVMLLFFYGIQAFAQNDIENERSQLIHEFREAILPRLFHDQRRGLTRPSPLSLFETAAGLKLALEAFPTEQSISMALVFTPTNFSPDQRDQTLELLRTEIERFSQETRGDIQVIVLSGDPHFLVEANRFLMSSSSQITALELAGKPATNAPPLVIVNMVEAYALPQLADALGTHMNGRLPLPHHFIVPTETPNPARPHLSVAGSLLQWVRFHENSAGTRVVVFPEANPFVFGLPTAELALSNLALDGVLTVPPTEIRMAGVNSPSTPAAQTLSGFKTLIETPTRVGPFSPSAPHVVEVPLGEQVRVGRSSWIIAPPGTSPETTIRDSPELRGYVVKAAANLGSDFSRRGLPIGTRTAIEIGNSLSDPRVLATIRAVSEPLVIQETRRGRP